jgi:membrane protease YdiL (CAAX protease family)
MNAKSLAYWTLGIFVPSGIFLTCWSRQISLSTFLLGQSSLTIQLATGLLTGTGFGLFARFIASRRLMSSQLHEFKRIIGQMRLSTGEIWLISFSAGVGEEIFFRGGLQPLLGIWPTAILFVAIHGYLNPFNWRISVYGIALCCIIAALGYLTESLGILVAMTAHGMIDVILLSWLRSCSYPLPVPENSITATERPTNEWAD